MLQKNMRKFLPQYKTSELLVMFPSLSKGFALEVATRTFIQVPKSLFTGNVPVYRYCPSMQGFAQLI